MEKFTVYLLINVTLQEVFFGMTGDLNESVDALPPEIAHWDLLNHHISNPVMIEEALALEEAVSTIRSLEEKALKNPQGKTILLNRSV